MFHFKKSTVVPRPIGTCIGMSGTLRISCTNTSGVSGTLDKQLDTRNCADLCSHQSKKTCCHSQTHMRKCKHQNNLLIKCTKMRAHTIYMYTIVHVIQDFKSRLLHNNRIPTPPSHHASANSIRICLFNAKHLQSTKQIG